MWTTDLTLIFAVPIPLRTKVITTQRWALSMQHQTDKSATMLEKQVMDA